MDGTANEAPIVALASSVGGMDALIRVLGPLPSDFSAAVIPRQHLDPGRVSALSKHLSGAARRDETARRFRKADRMPIVTLAGE
jgi:chemotaxis response regulator CheB